MTAFVFHTTNPPDTTDGRYATFKNESGLMWNPNTETIVTSSQTRDDFDVQASQDGTPDTGEYRYGIPAKLPPGRWLVAKYKEDSVGVRSWANDTLEDEESIYWNGYVVNAQSPDISTRVIAPISGQTVFTFDGSPGVAPRKDGALIGYLARFSNPTGGEDGAYVTCLRRITDHVYDSGSVIHQITVEAPDFTIAIGDYLELFQSVPADLVAIAGSSTAATNAKKFFTTGYGPLICRTTVAAVDEQSATEVILQLSGLSQSGEPSYNGCTVIVRDNSNPDDVWVGHITGHSIDPEVIVIKPQQPTPFTIGVNDIVEILPPGMMLSDRESLGTVETTVGSSGGGILSARIGYSSLTPDEFLEIIQGEEKTITFVVEADGRFEQESATEIRVGFRCPEGNTIIKEDDDIERVCEAFDVQVIRTTLTPNETYELTEGLLRMEIAFDAQKAGLTRAIKIVEGLIGTGT